MSSIPICSRQNAMLVVDVVCRMLGVEAEQVFGAKRGAEHLVFARHAIALVCRRELRGSYPEIGRIFGRNHTVVMHGVKALVAKADKDEELSHVIGMCQRAVRYRLEADGVLVEQEGVGDDRGQQ